MTRLLPANQRSRCRALIGGEGRRQQSITCCFPWTYTWAADAAHGLFPFFVMLKARERTPLSYTQRMLLRHDNSPLNTHSHVIHTNYAYWGLFTGPVCGRTAHSLQAPPTASLRQPSVTAHSDRCGRSGLATADRPPHAAVTSEPPTHPLPPRLLDAPHTPHAAVCGAREHPSGPVRKS